MKQINFRKLITSSGTLVLAGKNSENNEDLIKQVGKEEEVFHTEKPGSPFVNIKGKPAKEDLKESALFCAIYSKDWKKNRKDVVVHRFKGKDIFKETGMKTGTFGVKKYKAILLKKEELMKYENNIKINK